MDVTLSLRDAGEALLATLPAFSLTYTRALDEIGSLTAEIPADAPGANLLAVGLRLDAPGFNGVIDDVAVQYADDGTASYGLLASELQRELVWSSAGYAIIAAGTTLSAALTTLLAGTGWTASAPTLGSAAVYLAAEGASRWQSLRSLAGQVGARVVRTALRTLQLIDATTATRLGVAPSPDLPAGQLAMLRFTRRLTAQDATTEVYPYGAGNSNARLDLWPADEALAAGHTIVTADYGAQGIARGIRHTAGYSALGARTRFIQFPEIAPIYNTDGEVKAAANALLRAAVAWLDAHAQPVTLVELGVGSAETLLAPGEAISTSLHGAPLAALSVRTSFDEAGVATQDVTAGGRLLDDYQSGANAVVRALETERTFRAHAQLFANVHTIQSERRFSNSVDASFTFRVDEAVTQIRRLALDVLLSPLESAVAGVSAPASAVAAAAHTHTTPALAAHTHDLTNVKSVSHAHTLNAHTHSLSGVVAHTHYWEIQDRIGPAGSANLMYWDNALTPKTGIIVTASAGTVRQVPVVTTGTATATGGPTPTTTANDGPRAVEGATPGSTATTDAGGSVAAGTSGSGGGHAHAVTVTPRVQYGLWKDSTSNVFAASEVEIQLNSSAWKRLDTGTAMSGGWRRLDLTADAVDPLSLRPKATSNTVRIRTTLAARVNVETFVAYDDMSLRRYNSAWSQTASYTLPAGDGLCRAVRVDLNGRIWVLMANTLGGIYATTAGGSTFTLVERPPTSLTDFHGLALSPNGQIFARRSMGGGQAIAAYSGPYFDVITQFTAASVGARYLDASGNQLLWTQDTTQYVAALDGSGQTPAGLVDAPNRFAVRYDPAYFAQPLWVRASDLVYGGTSIPVSPAPIYSHATLGTRAEIYLVDNAAFMYAGQRIVGRDPASLSTILSDSGTLPAVPTAFFVQPATDARRARAEMSVTIASYIQAIVPV